MPPEGTEAPSVRETWKQYWKGFVFGLGSFSAAYAAAFLVDFFKVLRVDFAWQIAFALLFGFVVTLAVLWVATRRFGRERSNLRRRVQALKSELTARPREWMKVESGEVLLTPAHPVETFRYDGRDHTELQIVLNGDGGLFNVEVLYHMHQFVNVERNAVGAVWDSKHGVPKWERVILIDDRFFYFIKVSLPKESQGVRITHLIQSARFGG